MGGECLFVNDGSTDPHVTEMLAEAARGDNRCRVVVKENGGPSSARNLGLAEARCEWVTFVDADDRLLPGSLAMMIATAEREQADVAIFAAGKATDTAAGQSLTMNEGRDRVTRVIAGKALRQLVADTVGGRDVTERYGVSLTQVWARLFRREFLVKAGVRFREDLHVAEDLLFCAQAYHGASRVAVDPRPVYDYVYNAESITHTPSPRFRLTARAFVGALSRFVDEHYHGEPDVEAALLRRVFPFAEIYASARFAASRREGRSLTACRRELAEWMRDPLVCRSATTVTPDDLAHTGYGGLRNRVKLLLFRYRLTTPYLLLMLLQERMARRA